jgi:hypothetical protein
LHADETRAGSSVVAGGNGPLRRRAGAEGLACWGRGRPRQPPRRQPGPGPAEAGAPPVFWRREPQALASCSLAVPGASGLPAPWGPRV